MKTTPASYSFQWRALVTMTVTLSFAILAGSGLVLSIAPPGRVANWTDWTLGGLRKAEWIRLHLNFAAVFLGAVGLHLYFNWRPMMSYLRNRVRRRIGFRPEWVVALLVAGAVVVGTLADIAPFSSLVAGSETLKASWERPTERGPIPLAPAGSGESGRTGGGYGRMTLEQFCDREGLALELALSRLRGANLRIEEGLTLRELAQLNGQTRPARLLEIIRGESNSE